MSGEKPAEEMPKNDELPKNTEGEKDRPPAGPEQPAEEQAEKPGERKEQEEEKDEKLEEVLRLREQLEAAEQECRSSQDNCLRAYAELENYKKRVAKDQGDLIKYANERLLKEILPVVDNLERAIFHTKDTKEPEKILEGLELILKQSQEVLAKSEVTAFDSRLMPFDPSLHQAMGQVESDEHEEGTVIEEIQKGYRLNDRVLRPAMVMISKKPAAQDPKETPPSG